MLSAPILMWPWTWVILLLPLAIFAAIAALCPTFVWRVTLLFVVAAMAACILGDYYSVFVHKNIDPRFRDGLWSAFEIALKGTGAQSLLLTRKGYVPASRGTFASLPAGFLFGAIAIPLCGSSMELLRLSGWLVVIFPALAARFTLSRPKS